MQRQPSVALRRQTIERWKLCVNCILPATENHQCRASYCRVCGPRNLHNSLLCERAEELRRAEEEQLSPRNKMRSEQCQITNKFNFFVNLLSFGSSDCTNSIFCPAGFTSASGFSAQFVVAGHSWMPTTIRIPTIRMPTIRLPTIRRTSNPILMIVAAGLLPSPLIGGDSLLLQKKNVKFLLNDYLISTFFGLKYQTKTNRNINCRYDVFNERLLS